METGTHEVFAKVLLNAVSVDEASDRETARTVLLVLLDRVAPDHRQVVNDPVLLVVEQDAFLEKAHLLHTRLARVVGLGADLDAFLLFQEFQLKQETNCYI